MIITYADGWGGFGQGISIRPSRTVSLLKWFNIPVQQGETVLKIGMRSHGNNGPLTLFLAERMGDETAQIIWIDFAPHEPEVASGIYTVYATPNFNSPRTTNLLIGGCSAWNLNPVYGFTSGGGAGTDYSYYNTFTDGGLYIGANWVYSTAAQGIRWLYPLGVYAEIDTSSAPIPTTLPAKKIKSIIPAKTRIVSSSGTINWQPNGIATLPSQAAFKMPFVVTEQGLPEEIPAIKIKGVKTTKVTSSPQEIQRLNHRITTVKDKSKEKVAKLKIIPIIPFIIRKRTNYAYIL